MRIGKQPTDDRTLTMIDVTDKNDIHILFFKGFYGKCIFHERPPLFTYTRFF